MSVEPGSVCVWCEAEAYKKSGRSMFCSKHYRFINMRTTAKAAGKTVPSYKELEEMLVDCGMLCVGCDREMVWHSKQDKTRVVSLQHDRDGSHRLLCRSCNTRHAQMAGDSFYEVGKDSKKCPSCQSILPFTEFRTDNTKRWNNKQSYCKKCANARMRNWVAKNRERVNQKQREGRARRKLLNKLKEEPTNEPKQ